jgi:hypothetical protein
MGSMGVWGYGKYGSVGVWEYGRGGEERAGERTADAESPGVEPPARQRQRGDTKQDQAGTDPPSQTRSPRAGVGLIGRERLHIE